MGCQLNKCLQFSSGATTPPPQHPRRPRQSWHGLPPGGLTRVRIWPSLDSLFGAISFWETFFDYQEEEEGDKQKKQQETYEEEDQEDRHPQSQDANSSETNEEHLLSQGGTAEVFSDFDHDSGDAPRPGRRVHFEDTDRRVDEGHNDVRDDADSRIDDDDNYFLGEDEEQDQREVAMQHHSRQHHASKAHHTRSHQRTGHNRHGHGHGHMHHRHQQHLHHHHMHNKDGHGKGHEDTGGGGGGGGGGVQISGEEEHEPSKMEEITGLAIQGEG